MKCPLCGYEGELDQSACHSCPLAKSCNKVRCSNCGYEFVLESSLSKLIKRGFEFWRKIRRGDRNG